MERPFDENKQESFGKFEIWMKRTRTLVVMAIKLQLINNGKCL